jgi:hypothetical protein
VVGLSGFTAATRHSRPGHHNAVSLCLVPPLNRCEKSLRFFLIFHASRHCNKKVAYRNVLYPTPMSPDYSLTPFNKMGIVHVLLILMYCTQKCIPLFCKYKKEPFSSYVDHLPLQIPAICGRFCY